MEQLGNIKLNSLEEVTDELIGKEGTPERNDFDRKVDEVLHTYRIGGIIKNVRLKTSHRRN